MLLDTDVIVLLLHHPSDIEAEEVFFLSGRDASMESHPIQLVHLYPLYR